MACNIVMWFNLFFVLSETKNSSHPWLSDKKPIDVLQTILQTVSMHIEKGGTMTNQEDVLECLRPFCADVTVSAAIKTTVLQLMEESFDLSGEDTFLLLFYQTDAIVSSTWNRKVTYATEDFMSKFAPLYVGDILTGWPSSVLKSVLLGSCVNNKKARPQ